MFVKLSPKLTDEIKIQVDNRFILYFMPSAPAEYVKVYLYGLSLTSTNSELMTKDNSLDKMAKILNIPTDDIVNAYEYWAGLGIVNLDNTVYPPIVEYLPTIDTKSTVVKKYNVKKYADFNSQLQKMLPSRNFLPRELDEYYQLMESVGTNYMAMLAIIGYCVRLKGETISSNYILTVARNQAKQGNVTLEAVENSLSETKLYEQDIQEIFGVLKIRRSVDHIDCENYKKWTKEYKFGKETILHIAKKMKKGNIDLLDNRILGYYKLGLLSIKAIDEYTARYDGMFELAKSVAKTLSQYFERYDHLVDTYITEWMAMGFDEASILMLADWCSKDKRNSNFEQLHHKIYESWKAGRVNVVSLSAFAQQTKVADEFIKKLLDIIGENRAVISRDRDFYNTWVNSWTIPPEVVEYCAKYSKVTSLLYLNRTLADWKDKNIKTLAQAKKELPESKRTNYRSSNASTPVSGNKAAIQNQHESPQLSNEDVYAIFDNLTYDDL